MRHAFMRPGEFLAALLIENAVVFVLGGVIALLIAYPPRCIVEHEKQIIMPVPPVSI